MENYQQAAGWIRDLRDGTSYTRARAVENLQALGAEALPVLPDFMELLADPAEKVRWAAIKVLAGLAQFALPSVRALLDSPNPAIRVSVADVLLHCETADEQAIAVLLRDLAGPEVKIRERAAALLSGIGSVVDSPPVLTANPATIAALIGALADDSERVRQDVGRVLGNIGSAAHAAVPALVQLLKDPNEFLRATAANSLMEIGVTSGEVIDGLISILDDEFSGVRLHAAAALAVMGAGAAAAIPLLTIMAASDPNTDNRDVAAGAIEAIQAALETN